MKVCLYVSTLVISLISLQGCSIQQTGKSSATKDSGGHDILVPERHIGGDLYRNGRHIHHHPERIPPKKP